MFNSHFTTVALAVMAANEPSVATVIVTGLVLVFCVLILLYFIIILQGKIFTAIDKKKSEPKGGNTAVNSGSTAAISPAQNIMHIEQGISGDVVAAISAAISCLDNGKYSIRSLSRERAPKERSAWGNAGIRTNTEPF